MDLAWSSLAHDPGVARRDVPDVGREPVTRIERVESPHRPVAHDLGHDRCRCDRSASLVTVDDGHVLRRARPEAEAVDEAGFGGRGKRMQCSPQAGEVRAMQALSIDLGRRDRLHRDLRRAAEHRAEELLALFRAHLLRVVQKGERPDAVVSEELVVQKDAGDYERTGERAAPGLVSAGDEASAELSVEPQQPLGRLRRLPPALLLRAHPRELLRQRAHRLRALRLQARR